ncbi:MAG: hypothetical protein DHS20C19_08070 [Acidimicrobiales bacterium]|nr:MAG: hypothetical protein DHS20C19_08070 [Acidimicrobiales bacterium]
MRAIAVVFVALVVAAGCGAAEDREAQAVEDQLEAELNDDAEVTVDPDSDSVTVEDDNGSFTSGVDLPRPDWLDPAVPLPDDFSFDTLLTVGDIMSARGATNLDAEALAAFYTDALTDLGWSIDADVAVEPGFFQLFTTDRHGQQLDIELVQEKLAFVVGRVRPDG